MTTFFLTLLLMTTPARAGRISRICARALIPFPESFDGHSDAYVKRRVEALRIQKEWGRLDEVGLRDLKHAENELALRHEIGIVLGRYVRK